MTEWVRPASVEDALRARAAHPSFTVLAGGTDLLVGCLERPAPPGVIDLFALPGLGGIDVQGDGAIRIGAAATYAEILAHEAIRRELPILIQSCREVGAVQIQERGTLAGNLCTSSPVGDTLPVLLALDAIIDVASAARGARAIPYGDFITGYRKTALAADELVVAVRLPRPAAGTVQHWRKVGTRRAQAISKVMFAGAARLDGAGTIAHARLALGAVADRTIRVRAAEDAILGHRPDAALADRAAAAVAASITPIDDVRSTAVYRKTVAANLVRAFVGSLATA
jgi:CO/xanthine dehydrogenase FAD-binding subunit